MRFIGDVSAQDIKRINKALRLVEPELLKEIRTKIRSIAKPIETQIKKNIPTSPPMSGMGGVVFNKKTGNYSINEGRLRWDGAGLRASRSVKPNATSITSAIKASGRSLTTSLAKIVVRSPAVSMADMAGRANKSRGISREYVYRNRAGELVKRRHRVTTQGKKFIENLAGKASRYGWPALEAKIDDVAKQLETEVLDNYYRKLNRRF
jgi:hypothetical protein